MLVAKILKLWGQRSMSAVLGVLNCGSDGGEHPYVETLAYALLIFIFEVIL